MQDIDKSRLEPQDYYAKYPPTQRVSVHDIVQLQQLGIGILGLNLPDDLHGKNTGNAILLILLDVSVAIM